jgi:phage terminase Nu1 subunit (DNA packaging protein)
MGKLVHQIELAEIMGVSDVTIWQWQKDGLPIKVRNLRGQSNEYDTADVIEWKIARVLAKVGGAETQDQRLKRVQADKIEIEIAEKRLELVPAVEIEARWAALVIAARRRLLEIPDGLAQLLEVTPGLDAKRDLLREAVDRALSELATHDDPERVLSDFVTRLLEQVAKLPAESGGSEGADEVGAAATADGGGMGGGKALPL